MTRVEMVRRLLAEGLSRNTLVNATDKQLSSLCERMLGEQTTSSTVGPIDAVIPNSPNATKTLDKLKKAGVNAIIKENDKICSKCGMKKCECKDKKHGNLKGNQTKLDANKNGKIDKEDFKLLKNKKSTTKTEVKEGDKKWIQKALDPSKKGSLKKALGVKKDEKIPADKLKAATKRGGKIGQRARMATTLKKLKESEEVNQWVSNLAETKYHSFTSKNEIMELIKTKLNEVETASIPMPATKAKKGHNGVPEFMTYDAIMAAAPKEKEKETETPVREKPTEKPGTSPKPGNPFSPKPGPNHAPKALAEKKSK